MGSKYSKVLTVFLIIIIIAVIGLVAYLGFNFYSKYKINKDAQEFVESSTSGVTVDVPTDTVNSTGTSINDITTNSTAETQTQSGDNSEAVSGRKTKTYKGFYIVGTIDIPKTNCKYPIIEKVTKKALETAVAVDWPQDPILNRPGNVVIAGHNYRNGVFFSNNKKLSKGDKIYITDYQENKKVTYTIYKIFETSDNDASFYNRDTDGKREITLKTCTDDSLRRLIIQARE